MNTYTHSVVKGLAGLLLAWQLAAAASAFAADAANPTTLPFAAGGAVRIKLNQGDAEILGADADRITVSWRSDAANESTRQVKVRFQRIGENEASVFVDGPGNGVRYRIEIPRRSDVAIHMRAGELKVEGIAGSMDIDLIAGDLDLRLTDPHRYRTVAASVTAGEIDAKPWQAEKAGLWRSLKLSGEGDYDLRARLIAGQLTIRADKD